jgi:hypothetical protein
MISQKLLIMTATTVMTNFRGMMPLGRRIGVSLWLCLYIYDCIIS